MLWASNPGSPAALTPIPEAAFKHLIHLLVLKGCCLSRSVFIYQDIKGKCFNSPQWLVLVYATSDLNKLGYQHLNPIQICFLIPECSRNGICLEHDIIQWEKLTPEGTSLNLPFTATLKKSKTECSFNLPRTPAHQPYRSRSWFLHLLLHICHLPQSLAGSVYHSAWQSLRQGPRSNLQSRKHTHKQKTH